MRCLDWGKKKMKVKENEEKNCDWFEDVINKIIF